VEKPWNHWEARRRELRTASEDRNLTEREIVAVDYSSFTTDKYIFTQCTALGGVEVGPEGYQIVPEHSVWVNRNGLAFRNEQILLCYPSLIMAENFLEHTHYEELSKGKILDAVPWVHYIPCPGGESIPTIFVDVLIATSKYKAPRLCEKIKNGKINAVSMGCDLTHAQCTQCGRIVLDGIEEPCDHVLSNLGGTFRGKDGTNRIVAELGGRPNDPDSCTFVEVSWVKRPAFVPAIFHGMVPTSAVSKGKPLEAYVPLKRLTS